MQSRLTSVRNSCINKKRLRQDKAIGSVIVFVTSGSQEEKWFTKMTEELSEPFIYCTSIKQLIDKL